MSFGDYQLNVVNAEGGGKIGNTLNAGGIVIDSLSASLERHSHRLAWTYERLCLVVISYVAITTSLFEVNIVYRNIHVYFGLILCIIVYIFEVNIVHSSIYVCVCFFVCVCVCACFFCVCVCFFFLCARAHARVFVFLFTWG